MIAFGFNLVYTWRHTTQSICLANMNSLHADALLLYKSRERSNAARKGHETRISSEVGEEEE